VAALGDRDPTLTAEAGAIERGVADICLHRAVRHGL